MKLPQISIGSIVRHYCRLNRHAYGDACVQYLDTLEQKGISCNAAYLAPHGNIRLEVMGWDSWEVTDTDITAMKNVLRREMHAGAIGLSAGLIYTPCAYAAKRELIEFCQRA